MRDRDHWNAARYDGTEAQTFTTQSRAAFEILTDDSTHGIPVLAA